MRLALLLALVLPLAACAGDDAPADDVSVAGPITDTTMETPDDGVSTAGAVALASAADLDGDWVQCTGPSALDTAVTFENGEVATYIDGRPGVMGRTYTVDGDGTLALSDGSRYAVSLDGDTVTLTDAAAPGGEAAVYARSTDACP